MKHFTCGLTALLMSGNLIACAVTSSSSSQDEAPAHAFAPQDAWTDLSYEERHEKMTFVILPALAHRFKEAGGQKTARLTCQSCHGERAEEVRYRMPAIEALRPDRVAEIYTDDAQLSPLVRFMRDDVTPMTARLMGVAVYDPATRQGFSCFNCHLKERK